jgi:hypothetical protein
MPDVLEAMDILKAIRVGEGEEFDGFEVKKKLIKSVIHLVDYEGMGYESAEDVMKDINMFGHLSRFADEIHGKVIEAFAKKP